MSSQNLQKKMAVPDDVTSFDTDDFQDKLTELSQFFKDVQNSSDEKTLMQFELLKGKSNQTEQNIAKLKSEKEFAMNNISYLTELGNVSIVAIINQMRYFYGCSLFLLSVFMFSFTFLVA